MPAEPFIAEITLWSGNFAPRGWAFCHGQLLPIAQNTALYSLIGNYYGGDGRTTFALPDLRGRVPVGAGSGPGLTPYSLAEQGGAATVPLTPFDAAPAGDLPVAFGAFPQSQQSVPVVQPYLALNYIIALYGIYPSRS